MGALVAAHGTADVRPGAHADMWFMVLDQRMLHVGPETWNVHVLGIHDSPQGLWIQLAPIDDPKRGLVLLVDEHTSIAGVTAALSALPASSSPLQVVRVSGPAAPAWPAAVAAGDLTRP